MTARTPAGPIPARPGPRAPDRRILLDLARDEAHAGLDEELRSDLSVVAIVGPHLFTASDETATVERLTEDGPERYGAHETYRLADLLDLPDPDGEVDVEGIAADGGWLWVAGSHSLARRRPKPDEHDPAKMLRRLTRVKTEPNRYLVARIPLDADRRPVRRDGDRVAACVPFAKRGNALTELIGGDPQLAPFLGIPAKENGFDVEGLEVDERPDGGARVFLGLRGPVLRGWAVVLEVPLVADGGALAVGAAGISKHFLDLDGLGVRELARDGEDLLVLAGPTMDLDGPVRVVRWRDALGLRDHSIVPRGRLEALVEVPHGIGHDHAEGLCIRPAPGGGRELVVAYDNPGADRLSGDTAVYADAFALA